MAKDRDDGFKDKEITAAPSAIMQYRKRWDEFRVATHDEALRCYRKYFIELVLRQKPLKPSERGRQIPLGVEHDPALIDERRGQPYITNAIRTSRYTVYDFVPKQLIFQFTRLANFYFLCVGIPQTIPGVSTTGNFTTILPLLFFVLLTIVKEGYDDFKRHRLDTVENANPATVIRQKSWSARPPVSSWKWFSSRYSDIEINIELHDEDEETDSEYSWKRIKWRDIGVGDIVKLSRDEHVPADMVLLHASGEEGVAYFDTMDLDGETNLKTKEPPPDFKVCGTIAGIRTCHADFVLEDPNADLYQFDGQVAVNEKRLPLTSNEVVYRGSTLRNTERAIGMVINTGEECKIRLNANQHPDAKKPALEKISNRIVIILVVYVICLTIGCSRGYKNWQVSTERNSPYLDGADVLYDQIVIGYAIMYNNNIPLALYITLEIVRIIQMLMLNGDLGMYDEASDTPAQCNTNTILENLGQVSYIFSDKTGTLTENVMKFRKMSIAGTAWLHEADMEPEETPASRVPSKVSTGPRQAHFHRSETIESKAETVECGNPITTPNGGRKDEVYQILDVIEFSSKRKRMSIVVRFPDGRIFLICKGADSAILPRLKLASLASQKVTEVRKSADLEREMHRRSEQMEKRNSFGGRPSLTLRRSMGGPQGGVEHLDDFATEGLRTLVIARKFISETEYKAWRKIYNEATTSLVNRQDMIEAAGEMIEQCFDLVGATAIEDKLQAGVPETIDKLRRANIKIWMLTGDKRETAINIAHSARICQPASDIFILDSTKGNLETQIHGVLEDIKTGCVHSVAVIDGQTLSAVEQSPALEDLFYTLIPKIDAVICCRASPAQKSLIVQAIRNRVPRALTLAVGDGANDLAMISASHVGVGISGKEGLQAARVADYSVAQFRFLQRLLLVHGRWNYVRTARFYLATFWKEVFFYVPTAMYQRYNGYSGTSLYEMWSLTVLNFLFTSLCTICMGVWEQDLAAETLLAVPELYVYGQRNCELNVLRFLRWMIAAAAEGVLVWLGVWASYSVFGLPRDNGLFAIGDLAFTICIIWINYKLMIIETHHKTSVVMGAFLITIAGWFAWQAFLDGSYARQPSPYAARDGFTVTFGRDPLWWLTALAIVFVLIVIETSYKAIKRRLVVAGFWRLPRAVTAPWNRIVNRGQEEDFDDEGNGNVEEWHLELWQELEKDPVVRERLRRILEDEERGFMGGADADGERDGNDTIEEEGGVRYY
ncbi:putative phospholipid-transporting atpase 1 protein [Eutypa lata UCREL1]|uniref:Phospholipid-transporting ATPase n=1 Tax=Eutypa lata (strain UCR-EL1) TaxID=1287681 RepID=M7SQU0_EUTLA|nr:putative phospholipid-transporting atpase 1 protein [Eutypa lata UCREL1]